MTCTTVQLSEKINLTVEQLSNTIKIVPSNQDNDYLILINHLQRVMNKYSQLSFNDYIEKLKNVYSDKYSYCTHSGDLLETSIQQFITSKDNINSYYLYVTNNSITDRFKRDSLTLSLQLLLGLSCLTNKRCVDIVKNIPNTLDSTISYNSSNVTQLYDAIKNANGDVELSNKIGQNSYGVIKYLLSLSKIQMSSLNDDIIKSDQFIIPHAKGTHVFTIDYPHSVSKLFDNVEPEFLYHGSSFNNWFVILKNGLKNLSGSKLMTNGATYGPGVYLADNYGLSFGYGRDRESTVGLHSVAITQVLGKKQDYHKSSGIFVVADDSKLIVRYLILTNNSTDTPTLNYLMKTRVASVKNSITSMINLAARRIAKDCSDIDKHLTKYGYSVNTSEEQQIIIKMGDEYKFSMEFPTSYPLDPPKLYIDHPIIDKCSVISDGGLILIPEFTISKWNSKTKIYKILKATVKNFIELYKTKSGTYDRNKEYGNEYTDFLRSVMYT